MLRRYPGMTKNVISNVNLQCSLNSRIAILGANGAGKSTMVKALIGELEACEGTVWKHPNLRVAYVAQHAFHHIEKVASCCQSHGAFLPVRVMRFISAELGNIEKEAPYRVLGMYMHQNNVILHSEFTSTSPPSSLSHSAALFLYSWTGKICLE